MLARGERARLYMIIPRLLERRDSCSPSVCSTIAFCSPFPVFRFKYTGASRDTHTHSGRAHSRTLDEHTVTDRESHDHTDPQRHTTMHTTTQAQTSTDSTRRRTGKNRSRTPRCQSAATDQGEAAPDSEEGGEPNPAPSRSQSASPRLLEGGRRADGRYHHWLESASFSL